MRPPSRAYVLNEVGAVFDAVKDRRNLKRTLDMSGYTLDIEESLTFDSIAIWLNSLSEGWSLHFERLNIARDYLTPESVADRLIHLDRAIRHQDNVLVDMGFTRKDLGYLYKIDIDGYTLIVMRSVEEAGKDKILIYFQGSTQEWKYFDRSFNLLPALSTFIQDDYMSCEMRERLLLRLSAKGIDYLVKEGELL